MKFEFSIPDDTRPEVVAKVRQLLTRLEQEPEIAEEFEFDLDALIQSKLTPEVLEDLDRIRHEMSLGQCLSEEGLDRHISQRRKQWILSKQDTA